MKINAKKGEKVVFANPDAGYARDRETAQKYLNKGQIYTVKRTEVDSHRTRVFLKKVPGVAFNSVMFE